MGVGNTGKIIGETDVGETGVGEMGVIPVSLLPFRLLPFCLLPFRLLSFHLLSNVKSVPFRLHSRFLYFDIFKGYSNKTSPYMHYFDFFFYSCEII